MAYAGVNETPAHIWSRKDGKYGEQQLEITCLHYGTLSCYKSLFDGGLDQTRYPFVYSGYLLQKDG